MKNITAKFAPDRLERMIQASVSYDPRNSRFDSCNRKQQWLLQGLVHRDASESIWFARQLEYIRPGLLEVLYPRLEGKSLVPVDSSIGPGAQQWTYRAFNKVGAAALVEDYSTDPPRADVSGIEATQVIRPYAVMYGYNFQELRAGMMAQLPLDVRKAMAARYAMELKIDQIIFYGDTAGGLKGLLNQSSTTAFTVANGVKGTKLWRDKTPDEVVLDMHNFVNNVVSTSLGVYQPTTLLLPLKAYQMASTRRMGDGSNETILSFFQNTNPYIQEVRPTYRLDQSQSANWSGTTGRMCCYDKDPERLVMLLPVEFEQLAPQQMGFEYKTLCHMRTGGVVALHPASISYGDGITDASD